MGTNVKHGWRLKCSSLVFRKMGDLHCFNSLSVIVTNDGKWMSTKQSWEQNKRVKSNFANERRGLLWLFANDHGKSDSRKIQKDDHAIKKLHSGIKKKACINAKKGNSAFFFRNWHPWWKGDERFSVNGQLAILGMPTQPF